MIWRLRKWSTIETLDLSWKKLKFLYTVLPRLGSKNFCKSNLLKINDLPAKKSSHHHSSFLCVKNTHVLNNNARLLHNCVASSTLYQNYYRLLSTSSAFQDKSQNIPQNSDSIGAKDPDIAISTTSSSSSLDGLTAFDESSTAVSHQVLDLSVLKAASNKSLILPDLPFVQGAEATLYYVNCIGK